MAFDSSAFRTALEAVGTPGSPGLRTGTWRRDFGASRYGGMAVTLVSETSSDFGVGVQVSLPALRALGDSEPPSPEGDGFGAKLSRNRHA